MYNIAIIDDSPELLRELADYFNESQQFKCVLALNSVEKFIKYYRDFLNINIVLLDIILFKKSGIDGIPQILQKAKDVKIVIFSILDDKEAIFQSLSLGASGYLIKNISLSELEEKLVNLMTKAEYPISKEAIKYLVQYFQPADSIRLAHLGMQEFRIARLLADGMSYQSIADLFSLSINGVRFHVKKIYRKLNITNRQALKMLFANEVKKNKTSVPTLP